MAESQAPEALAVEDRLPSPAAAESQAPESTTDGAPAIPENLPLLPLRGGMVVFPLAVVPLMVGQERSVRLVDDVMRGNRLVVLVSQRDETQEHAGRTRSTRLGPPASSTSSRAPDGTLRLAVQGIERVRVLEYTQTDPYFRARVERRPTRRPAASRPRASAGAVLDLYGQLVQLIDEMPNELAQAAKRSASRARWSTSSPRPCPLRRGPPGAAGAGPAGRQADQAGRFAPARAGCP